MKPLLPNDSNNHFYITRSIPFDEYMSLVGTILQGADSSRSTLLVQQGLRAQYPELGKYACLEIPKGRFTVAGLGRETKKQIKQKKAKYFIIPSNNPLFVGYEEFVKLAMLAGAKEIILITKEETQKRLSRARAYWYIYRSPLCKYLFFINRGILFLGSILLFIIFLPYAYMKYRFILLQRLKQKTL